MDIKKSKVLIELDAMIPQAWGDGHDGCAIKCDPALGRTLEWIRDCYAALYEQTDNSFDEEKI